MINRNILRKLGMDPLSPVLPTQEKSTVHKSISQVIEEEANRSARKASVAAGSNQRGQTRLDMQGTRNSLALSAQQS